MMNKMKKRKGFTLIKLIIVVAVIGILALLAVPKFADVTDGAKASVFESNCQAIVTGISMYQAQNSGDYPTTTAQIGEFISGGFPASGTDGDPAGANYTYTAATHLFEATYSTDKKTYSYKYPGAGLVVNDKTNS